VKGYFGVIWAKLQGGLLINETAIIHIIIFPIVPEE
jgi:hypothetical protein